MAAKKLTFKQHVELSVKTMSKEVEQLPGTGRALLAVHALGLVNEAIEAFEWLGSKSYGASVEVHNKVLAEELGDMLWYLVTLHHILPEECGIIVPEVEYPASSSSLPKLADHNPLAVMATIIVYAKEIGEMVKKYANHGHEFNVNTFTLATMSILANTQVLLKLNGGMDIRACAAKNIAKLKKRYPDGFSFARSINRE